MLVSDGASYGNGAFRVVDGGWAAYQFFLDASLVGQDVRYAPSLQLSPKGRENLLSLE